MFNVSNVDLIIRAADPMTKGHWVTDFLKLGVQFHDIRSDHSRVDLLIGDDIAAHLYTGKICHLSYGPSAMETVFGWAPCGKLPLKPSSSGALMVTTLISKDRPISDLWALDTIGIDDYAATESRRELELGATHHFQKTVSRDEHGRYEVELPFLSNSQSLLPSNYSIAERRLRTTTSKLKKDGYFDKYDLLFKQWQSDGMIETVNSNGSSIGASGASLSDNERCRLEAGGASWDAPHTSCGRVHYLPHRAVLKLSSATTPIRPVFDASARSKGSPSLNDCLERGPNLLELIPALLTRFRLYQHAAVADIKKAFQQISVKEMHRDFLRFLWWEDESCRKIRIYRHTRVVFGVSSSPFLLGITLQHHLNSAPPPQRVIADKLRDNFYVDNVVVSFPTREEVTQFQIESQNLLIPAQFDLRGWEFGPTEENKSVPVLGLIWNLKEDSLSLELSSVLEKLDNTITKRTALSICHSVFDPLGIAAPFMILGKFILQGAHKMSIAWDTELPDDLREDMIKWRKQLPLLSHISLPRFTHFDESKSTLHIFCDASQSAYAAVAFLRVETNSIAQVHFLMAKARVTPVKKVTIPRLELIACLIGARLGKSIMEYLHYPRISVTFWSDSTTALTWISGDGPWSVFVANRAQEIALLTTTTFDNAVWRHVPGIINPADIASRGCSAKKLLESAWLYGPTWLQQSPNHWPSGHGKADPLEVAQEQRKTITTLLSSVSDHFIYELAKCSSFIKVSRVLAYVLRYVYSFINKFRPEKGFLYPPPSRELRIVELHNAENVLFRIIQNKLDDSTKLKQLKPVADNKGILRLQTRLIHDDEYGFLNPIILPADDQLVEMLIMDEHLNNSHAGVQFVLGSLRERFWILNGRRTVRKIIKKCSTCRRFLSQKLQVERAPLPQLRTGDFVPFTTTGVDMAGPLYLSDGRKVWIALFSCAVYRAVHIEITDTLSTDGFFNCLRRFVCRRGRPKTIFSDNGLNFVGASRILKRINWSQVEALSSVDKIQWIFNPPSAAWWGGWWERMIGLVKTLLRKILGNKVVNYEQLLTISVEIEEILNNRPLTTLTEDPVDLIPLTPNMFIRNSMMNLIPELDVHDAKSKSKLIKKLHRLRQALRSRFRREYLGFLRCEQFKSCNKQPLKPGDVVIVENELQKRIDWPLAVVVEGYEGRGGYIRTYKVRTAGGEYIRPAQRLYPVEIIE